MQRVIGLDIGSYSIKAVEIVNTLKSYEIVNFYENVIPHLEDVPMEVVAPSCMEQLFKENHLEADRIITAMPGQFISSRVLSLGFSDPKKVETAVFAEMEEAAPFNLDDMILDHQVLGNVAGKSVTLAVMTRKAFLRSFLDLLLRIDIDPKLVDIDSLAFYNLSPYMETNPGESIAMVDIGHEKTSMCIVRDGVLRLFRSINLGGRYITEFLARDLETTFSEAQRIKHRTSQVFCSQGASDEVSGDDRMIVERTTLAANAIIKELGRTIYAFKSWEKDPLTKIFLSGGTSRIKDLGRLIEDQLEVETVHCQLANTELKINPELEKHAAVMPQSIAIGLRTVSSVKKHSQINLRKGEFAFVQNYETVLKGIFTGAKVASVVLALLLVSYTVKHIIYSKYINQLEVQYKKELLQVVPPSAKKKLVRQTDFLRLRKDGERLLKAEINSMKSGIDIFKEQNSGGGALRLLLEISEAIPKGVKVDVRKFQFTAVEGADAKIEVGALTEGYKVQAEVMKAFKNIPSLTDVREKQSGIRPGSKGKIVEFTIIANYPMPGQNKG